MTTTEMNRKKGHAGDHNFGHHDAYSEKALSIFYSIGMATPRSPFANLQNERAAFQLVFHIIEKLQSPIAFLKNPPAEDIGVISDDSLDTASSGHR